MVTLFHVSSHKLRPNNVLRLVLPTPHFKNYTRGFALASLLASEATILSVLAELRNHHCMQCPDQTTCPASKPCLLVADILYSSQEFHHRAHQFVEHLFEWERERCFHELPSRFACFFCWERLEDALWFRREYRGGQGFVYRVRPAEDGVQIHRGDMKWLDCLMHDVQEIQQRARAYWRGEMCPDHGGGKWEVLVPCDLVVLEEVRFVGNSRPAEGGASPWNGSDGRG